MQSLHRGLSPGPDPDRRERHPPAARAFIGEQVGKACIGCEKCVTICPGLAVTLVDYRKDPDQPS